MTGLILQSLLWVLAAWALAFGATLFVFMAFSVDDLGEVVVAALAASAPAMWLVPALLLLATLMPWPTIAGLLLIANSVRTLVSVRAPRRRMHARAHKPVPERLFRAEVSPGFVSRENTPAIAGVFMLQAGVWAAYEGYALAAAALCAAAVSIWTRTSIAKGATQPQAATTLSRAVLRVVPVLLLSILLSMAGFTMDAAGPEVPEPAGGPAAVRRLLARLAGPPEGHAAPVQKAGPKVVNLEKYKDGIPGLILRTEAPRQRPKVMVPFTVPAAGLKVSQPLLIPFTGEYRLFRQSSGQPPPGSLVQYGSPLDNVYVTTNLGAMQMEAFQPFDPPVDFTRCGRVQLTLLNREVSPATLTLSLVAGGAVEEIGLDIFGLHGAPEETLEFLVPDAPRRRPVSAIRVRFALDPKYETQSARVAIKGFTLFPRGL